MSVSDGRTPPFIWVTIAALQAIRTGLEDEDPGLTQVRSVYGALIEVANEKRARATVGEAGASFRATRERVGKLSGASIRTVSRSITALERVGVLLVEREEDQQLPSRYTLVEPGVPGTESPTPGTEVPGVPGTESPTTTQEEKPTTKKKTVNRKVVSENELSLTAAVVSQFNSSAGTALSVDAHLTPIVGRIREKPDYTEDHHRKIIEAVFAGEHWWTGPPTPKIIYGNAAIFEQSIELARARRKQVQAEDDPNAERRRVEQEFDEAN